MNLTSIGRVGVATAMFLAVAGPAVAQDYKSVSDPLTARHGGNDVAYMYGSFVKEAVSGDDYLRNNTYIKDPDLDHAVHETTQYYWMNSDGYWVDGASDDSPDYQTSGWHFQYDHDKRSYPALAHGDMVTAVYQNLNLRPDPYSPVETSKNFWF